MSPFSLSLASSPYPTNDVLNLDSRDIFIGTPLATACPKLDRQGTLINKFPIPTPRPTLYEPWGFNEKHLSR